jgi:hypothetical protein
MKKWIGLTLTFGLALGVSALAQQKARKAASKADTETVIATYRVKEGQEGDFLKVLGKHWPTLRRLSLVMQEPHLVLRGTDESKKIYFVEILTWKSHAAPEIASAKPEVKVIWDAMQPLVEDRLGHRGIEFPEVKVVRLEEK